MCYILYPSHNGRPCRNQNQSHGLCQIIPTHLKDDKHEGTVVVGKRRGFRDFTITSSLFLPLITRSVTFGIYLNSLSLFPYLTPGY